MRGRTRVHTPALLITSALAAGACRPTPVPAPPTELRIGMIAPVVPGGPLAPARDEVRARYAGFVAYLQTSLELPCTIEATRDLTAMARDFEAGKYDLVFLGAVDFVRARERRGAIPLVARENDQKTTAVFLAAADDMRNSLQDFKGARLTFGPRASSSHVMARHYLEKRGIVPETYFDEVGHSANSDDTALVVLQGHFDLAATGAAAVTQLFQQGGLRPGEVKIIWETPPYASSVWAVSATLPEDLISRLRDAFLGLSPSNPIHVTILKSLNATAFLPASADDYRDVGELMHRMHPFDPAPAP